MHALIQAASAAEHHITFMDVLKGVPHDLAAVVVYVLSAVSIGWVIVAGRRKGERKPEES